MSNYVGDFAEDATVYIEWNSFDAVGASITRATDGTIAIYKNNDTSQKTSANGVTDAEDFDGITGCHLLTIDTSNDTADSGFWVTGADYRVMVQAATIDGQTVNAWIGSFSIENRFKDVNVAEISGDSAAADNLEATFDGTGYPDDYAPATQLQLAGVACGIAIQTTADAASLTDGEQTNTFAVTATHDGNTHTITDTDGSGIEIVYTFPLPAAGIPVTFHLHGNFDEAPGGGATTCAIRVYNFNTGAWQTIHTLDDSATEEELNLPLTVYNVAETGGTSAAPATAYDAGDTLILFTGGGDAADHLDVNHMMVGYTTTGINVLQWNGTAVSISGTSALPEVDTKSISDDATAANNLELITETAKGADHKLLISTDVQDLKTTLTVGSYLKGIMTTAITGTSAYIAAAFKLFFNVATPAATAETVNQTGDAYAEVVTAQAAIIAAQGNSDHTYYLSPATGSDANDGLTPATAWLTYAGVFGAAGLLSGIAADESITVYVLSDIDQNGVDSDIDNNKVRLVGVNRPRLFGSGAQNCTVTVKGDNVEITGFQIEHYGTGNGVDVYGNSAWIHHNVFTGVDGTGSDIAFSAGGNTIVYDGVAEDNIMLSQSLNYNVGISFGMAGDAYWPFNCVARRNLIYYRNVPIKFYTAVGCISENNRVVRMPSGQTLAVQFTEDSSLCYSLDDTLDGHALTSTEYSDAGSNNVVEHVTDVIDTNVDSILGDTAELQTDWKNGGRLDLLVDAIKAVTDVIVGADSDTLEALSVQLDTLAVAVAAASHTLSITKHESRT